MPKEPAVVAWHLEPSCLPEDEASSLTPVVGRAITTKVLQEDRSLHPPYLTRSFFTDAIGRSIEPEPLSAICGHLRHERNTVEFALGIEGGEDLVKTPYLNELPSPECLTHSQDPPSRRKPTSVLSRNSSHKSRFLRCLVAGPSDAHDPQVPFRVSIDETGFASGPIAVSPAPITTRVGALPAPGGRIQTNAHLRHGPAAVLVGRTDPTSRNPFDSASPVFTPIREDRRGPALLPSRIAGG